MLQATVCPSAKTVKQFLDNRLPDNLVAGLEEHLAHCDQCLSRWQGALRDDALMAALPHAARVADDPSSAVSLAGLRRWMGSLPSVDVATPLPHTLATPVTASPPRPDDDLIVAMLSPPQQVDELGRLGKYRVLKVLGRGGMGVVFLAEKQELGRLTALKVMRPGLASTAEYGQRFLREARAMAALSHPLIVSIYDVDEDRGMPFLAMEYLPGESLLDWLKREPTRPLLDVLRIAKDVAVGLAYAHNQGLVHRDVKPSNVWLCGERRQVKLLDFGLARLERGGDPVTNPGDLLGTPEFMAPEQAEGKPADARSDLFSLGVVLYQMCSGRLPFTGRNAMQVLRAVTSAEPPPLCQVAPRLPAALSDLVANLMEKNPARRPASAQAVVEALAGIARDSVQRGDAKMVVGATPADVPEAAKRRVPAERRPTPSAGRWLFAVLAIAAVVPLLVGGLILAGFMVRHPEPTGGTPPEPTKPEPPVHQGGGNNDQKGTKDPTPILPKPNAPLSEQVQVQKPLPLKDAVTWTWVPRRQRDTILSVAYQPNGNLIATAGRDDVVRLYDTTRNYELKKAFVGGLDYLRWSPDGKWLSVIRGYELWVWHVETGALVAKLPDAVAHGSWRAQFSAWSPDSKKLAYTGDDKVFVWDLESGKTRSAMAVRPCCLSWHPEGKRLAFGEHEGVVKNWDVDERMPWQFLKVAEGEVSGTGWSPDGKWFALGGVSRGNSFLRLWKGETEMPCPYGVAANARIALEWSPKSDRLILTGHSGSGVGVLTVRDDKEPTAARFTVDHGTPTSGLAWAPDGKAFATAGGDVIRVWDADKGKALHAFERDKLTNPGGGLLFNDKGDFKGPEGADKEIVYVVQTDKGQVTLLSAEEFEKKYGWKNDKSQVRGP